jgi:hypothetical protein
MLSILAAITTIVGSSANVVSCFGIGKFAVSDKDNFYNNMDAATNNRVSFSEEEANFLVKDPNKQHEMQNIVNTVIDKKGVKNSDYVKKVKNAENDSSKSLRLDVVSTTGVGGFGPKNKFGDTIYGDFDDNYNKPELKIKDYFDSLVKPEAESGVFDLTSLGDDPLGRIINPSESSIMMAMHDVLGMPYSISGLNFDIHVDKGYADVSAIKGSRRFSGSKRVNFEDNHEKWITEITGISPDLGNVEIAGTKITKEEVINALANKFQKFKGHENCLVINDNPESYGVSVDTVEGNDQQWLGGVYVKYNAQIKLETAIPNLDLGTISWNSSEVYSSIVGTYIAKANPGVKLDELNIKINDDKSSATISAKKQNGMYSANSTRVVTFNFETAQVNLNDLLGDFNIGTLPVAAGKEEGFIPTSDEIKEFINIYRDLEIDQFDVSNISRNGCTISAKENSEVYTGSVELTFTAKQNLRDVFDYNDSVDLSNVEFDDKTRLPKNYDEVLKIVCDKFKLDNSQIYVSSISFNSIILVAGQKNSNGSITPAADYANSSSVTYKNPYYPTLSISSSFDARYWYSEFTMAVVIYDVEHDYDKLAIVPFAIK